MTHEDTPANHKLYIEALRQDARERHNPRWHVMAWAADVLEALSTQLATVTQERDRLQAELQAERDFDPNMRVHVPTRKVAIMAPAPRGEVIPACPQCRGDLHKNLVGGGLCCWTCNREVLIPAYYQRVSPPVQEQP